MTSFKQATRDMLRTAPQVATDDAILEYALGLGGEAGEVIDRIKKIRFNGHAGGKLVNCKDPELLLELGDTLHYLTGLATYLGFTLDEVVAANVAKLKKRYPEGYSGAASVERVDTQKPHCEACGATAMQYYQPGLLQCSDCAGVQLGVLT